MWLLLTIIFPASVGFAVFCALFCAIRYGRHTFESRLSLLVVAYLVLAYVAGFVAICFHPYWIDNEVEEFIPFADRWSWAVLDATVFEVILCPLLVIGYSILRSRHNRNLRSSRVPTTTQVA